MILAISKPHKYRAEPTIVDGIRFASKKEAKRYSELLLLMKGREITEIELQPRFPIEINGHYICTYVADFRYHITKPIRPVIEDVKGVRTPLYKLKKKLVEAQYGIKIVEV